MADIEIRQYGARAARPQVDEADNRLSGRAAAFNSKTIIGPKVPGVGFREWINPKAFNKTLQDGDQVLLDNHDAHRPLARRSAGSLEVHSGSAGVDWRAVTANTSYARDVVENVRAGNYGGCSFSFEVVADRWTIGDDGFDERELVEINCREISIVTFPAYNDTSVANRSLELGLESRSAYWAGVMEPHITDEMRADGAPKPYGDVAYADPKNGKYPIDTAEHVKAAWAYINVAKNAAKYPLNGVTLESVKSRIKAAAAKFGIKISEGDNEAAPQDLRFEYQGVSLVVPMTAFDDAQWAEAQEAFRWFKQDLDYRLNGEPEESTRALSKEETALFEKRAADMRRAIYESRKASFRK